MLPVRQGVNKKLHILHIAKDNLRESVSEMLISIVKPKV